MDTLSRKHRIRKQQQQQEQELLFLCNSSKTAQQVATRICGKENRSFEAINHNNNSYNNNYEEDEDGEEQFRVFKVFENGKSLIGARQQKQSHSQRQQIGRQTEEEDEPNRRQQFSIVHLNGNEQQLLHSRFQSENSLKRSSYVADCSSGSSRSTMDGGSSGFVSASETTTAASAPFGAQPSSCHKSSNNSPARGSKVIDELDRLLGRANRNSLMASPSESCISNATYLHRAESTLTRNHEYDYSTMCRDEFSSFIAADEQPIERPQERRHRKRPAQHQQAGPTLIGVHEGDQQSLPAALRTNGLGLLLSESSSLASEASSSPATSDELDDRELVVLHNQFEHLNGAPKGQESSDQDSHKLSKMLDIYLQRVNTLLRLSKGDKTISLGEAFGDEELCVSEEFQTRIEFAPISRPKAEVRVLQEVFETNENGDENEMKVSLLETDSDFQSIAWKALQTSAELNWNHQPQSVECTTTTTYHLKSNSLVEPTDRLHLLEESLIRRFASANSLAAIEQHSNGRLTKQTVRRHLSEFLEGYEAYQNVLTASTSFASDWHQNWLFAYKKRARSCFEEELPASPSGSSRPKRARMSPSLPHECQQDTQEFPNDLIKYSTLLLSKLKPIKLTYLTREPESEFVDAIERSYAAQEERLSELYSISVQSSAQIDPCKLLLCSSDNLEEGSNCETIDQLDRSRSSRSKANLIVKYASSVSSRSNNLFNFRAFGYLFESRLLAPSCCYDKPEKLVELKEKILLKFKEMHERNEKIACKPSSSSDYRKHDSAAGEQVRFLVNLTSVELVNRLPVIQFCAKVSGSLPISVTWFRSTTTTTTSTAENNDVDSDNNEHENIKYEMLSAVSGSRRKNLRFREQSQLIFSKPLNRGSGAIWPIEMHANYDYEYQNEWDSWFRFRRRQGELIFEIRDANFNHDYNQTYKCVVQNHCSRKECTFRLTQRQKVQQVAQKVRRGLVKNAANRKLQDQGHAILRTWSQRTLHKPTPSTSEPLKLSPTSYESASHEEGPGKSWRLTVGRQSGEVARRGFRHDDDDEQLDKDKFGINFPYHPENLLKRLEENKFAVKVGIGKQIVNVGQTVSSPKMDDNDSFSELLICNLRHQEAQEEGREEEKKEEGEEEDVKAARVSQRQQQKPKVNQEKASPRLAPKPTLARANTNDRPQELSRFVESHASGSEIVKTGAMDNCENIKPCEKQEKRAHLAEADQSEVKQDERVFIPAYNNNINNTNSNTNKSSPAEEFGPKANVKSLISRFSSVA